MHALFFIGLLVEHLQTQHALVKLDGSCKIGNCDTHVIYSDDERFHDPYGVRRML